MRAVVVMIDTLNRRYLRSYGNDWVKTPNLDRVAGESAVFDRHWTGSAPCMPARRDIFTGRLNFLERNWGPIEPFDQALPSILKARGVVSHMITDHYHYFEQGGENYCQAFSSWDLQRGHEMDPWQTVFPGGEGLPPHRGKHSLQYAENRRFFGKEEDYPSVKVFSSAMEWLKRHGARDNYLLWVEPFSPHEPFDVPESYLRLYQDDYQGPLWFWPQYKPMEGEDERSLKHIRLRHAAALSMIDAWFGRLVALMREQGIYEDTLLMVATDHGFMLGEHGFMAKNYMPAYNEVFNIPLFIKAPGQTHRRVSAQTQNIDIFSTLLDYFGAADLKLRNPIHGRSLLRLAEGASGPVHDGLLYGYYGRSVNCTDGRYTYFRAPARADNSPLNLYTAMPTTLWQYYGMDELVDPGRMEAGRFLSWTPYPVWRIPAPLIRQADATQSFALRSRFAGESLIFDLEKDPGQNSPVHDPALEDYCRSRLARLMMEHEAPAEQYDRLGLGRP